MQTGPHPVGACVMHTRTHDASSTPVLFGRSDAALTDQRLDSAVSERGSWHCCRRNARSGRACWCGTPEVNAARHTAHPNPTSTPDVMMASQAEKGGGRGIPGADEDVENRKGDGEEYHCSGQVRDNGLESVEGLVGSSRQPVHRPRVPLCHTPKPMSALSVHSRAFAPPYKCTTRHPPRTIATGRDSCTLRFRVQSGCTASRIVVCFQREFQSARGKSVGANPVDRDGPENEELRQLGLHRHRLLTGHKVTVKPSTQ